MRKIVIWSWLLPLIGFLLNFIVALLNDEWLFGFNLNEDKAILLLLIFSIIGLFFVLLASKTLFKNPELKGRGHVIAGAIMSVLMLIISLHELFGDYFIFL